MNSKALELGLNNTHFETPHGLDAPEHYTTAYELALLSDYALKNPTFLSIVGTKNYTITINGHSKSLNNTNELLGNLNGVYGIKTGFTNGANRCLVTACKRGEMDIICVVLGADTKNFRTKDSIKLINYCFKNFSYFNCKEFIDNYLANWSQENPNYFKIQKGISNKLDIKIDTSSLQNSDKIPLKNDLIHSVKATLIMPSTLQAPVNLSDTLGELKLTSQNMPIATFKLLANNNIQKNNILNYLLNFFQTYPQKISSFVF